MSILCSSDNGWFISHKDLINTIYSEITDAEDIKSYKILSDLFEIKYPYKVQKPNLKRKAKEQNSDCKVHEQLKKTVEHVQNRYRKLQAEIRPLLQCNGTGTEDTQITNVCALELSQRVYDESGSAALTNAVGENRDQAKRVTINGNNFLFPSNCKFYCKDVAEIEHYLEMKYDLIVLDPPWWNKYVRRKKAKTNHGYQMMYNDNLKEIPIEKLLSDNGLIVVWCTNSLQHLEALQNIIFPKWNVHCVAKWYWLKITLSGEPICRFSEPPGKQPFEQIILGCRNPQRQQKPSDGKLIVSIPSALHSHKPPLIELLHNLLPENPKCLEIFARYLLPNWTSWGLEAARFQHESLYEPVLENI